MNCPHDHNGKRCGAPSEVLKTRNIRNTMERRRECYNGHRFTTHELVQSMTTHVQDVSKRNRDIVDTVGRGFSREMVANMFNVSRNTVYVACMQAKAAALAKAKDCGT